MNIISIATAETQWSVPRPAIILYHGGQDTRYRLDCERLFDRSEHPSNPLSWFDLDGPWLQKAREIFDSVERDASVLDSLKEKEIGIASCRERVSIAVVAVSLKNK